MGISIKKILQYGTNWTKFSELTAGITSTAASIFSNILRSTNTVSSSLTIYNVAADDYGLSVGVYWFVIAYFIIQYKVFSGKMDNIGYGER